MAITFLTNEDESKYVKSVNGVKPDETGNVAVSVPEGTVKSVNGVSPDENGNVEITIPDSGGNVDLTEQVNRAEAAATVAETAKANAVMAKNDAARYLSATRDSENSASASASTAEEAATRAEEAATRAEEAATRAEEAAANAGNGGNVDQSGLNAEASALLITILRNAVYSTNQNDNITALAAELDVTEAHKHSYTSTVTTAATCTTTGVRTYTCECGESYTEVIPVIAHNYVDGTCSVCGKADPNYNPEVTLTSISAVYSGGDVAVGTAVAELTGIVVTAHYSDNTSETVTGYTLSGTIAEGNNTVTVNYGGKTTTFTVVGVAESGGDTPSNLLYNWDLTKSLVDTVEGVELTTSASGATQDENGLALSDGNAYAMAQILSPNMTVEIDIVSYERVGTGHGRLLSYSGGTGSNDKGFIYRSTGVWAWYGSGWTDSTVNDTTALNGKTVSVSFGSRTGVGAGARCPVTVKVDGVELLTQESFGVSDIDKLAIGSPNGLSAYILVVSGLRVYEEV